MDINSSVLELAEKALVTLEEYGCMPGGHNGPYYDEETPVRNTAHWITIFRYCFSQTQQDKYKDAVIKCTAYLLSDAARPMGKTFFCRSNPKKDFSNGTIGQAWAIEGLVSAYKLLKDEKLLDVAEHVFLLHPFEAKKKVWKVVNVDGSHSAIDITYNHQLWFAAAGYMLLAFRKNELIKKQCEAFIDAQDVLLRTYSNGLVKHPLLFLDSLGRKLKHPLNTAKAFKTSIIKGKDTRYKENGYHMFNLYAFALIKESGANLPMFQSEKFKKSLLYCFSEEIFNWLEKASFDRDVHKMPNVKHTEPNIYGYAYNPPGFELPFIYKAFQSQLPNYQDLTDRTLRKQLELTFTQHSLLETKSTEDEATLQARVYELVNSL